jgi:hypothetical protein
MRRFLVEFDGLTSSRVQSRIAALFIHIGKTFSDSPTRHWEPVLQEVADTTAVGEIDVDQGTTRHER